MSICKNCGYIGGYHKSWCPIPHAATKYRVEWFGKLQVWQPIRPAKP